MCSGGQLLADFEAGTSNEPAVSDELVPHLTTTVDGRWVVWASKIAHRDGDQFRAVTGRCSYPADAVAECLVGGRLMRPRHRAPDPTCTCGFHAVSGETPIDPAWSMVALTVVLSGRVLAFEYGNASILWRAERQTVVKVDDDPVRGRDLYQRRRPDDPAADGAFAPSGNPHGAGPIRLLLPARSPRIRMCHDDAGWCAGRRGIRSHARQEYQPA